MESRQARRLRSCPTASFVIPVSILVFFRGVSPFVDLRNEMDRFQNRNSLIIISTTEYQRVDITFAGLPFGSERYVDGFKLGGRSRKGKHRSA